MPKSYNYKEKTGRPSKYDDSMIQIAQDYIDSCGREATELPTIEGLALKLGINTDTIVEWAKEHDEFSVTIKELKEKQKDQLINDGMYGGKEVNSTMAIFLLKANHGMMETEKQILIGEQESPIRIDVGQMLNKIYGADQPDSS